MLLKLHNYQSSYDNQFLLLLSLSLSDKIAFYKKEIANIADTSFNKQQKKLCLDILDKATEENIDKIYQFITQRVKTGFVFDIAPEVQNDCIALIKKDKKLSFESNALGEKLTHKLIIGENYDALKNLLAVYENKIDFIYIDPPYNTESTRTDGNSLTDIEGQNTGKFIYRDKFSRTGWLNMMNERLQLARKLLSDKGVIFISIDDNEQAYLKVLCDEVFGEENFVSSIPRITTPHRAGQEDYMCISHDYLIVYTKLKKFNNVISRNYDEDLVKEDSIGKYIVGDTGAILASKAQGYSKGGDYDVEYNGKIYKPIDKDGNRNRWLWCKERMEKAKELGILRPTANGLRVQLYLNKRFDEKTNTMIDKDDKLIFSTIDFTKKDIKVDNNTGTNELENIFCVKNRFLFPKPSNLIKYLLKMSSQKNSIILDFFAGSGTTGQAVMELNEEDGGKRQFILCTNNENGIAENITYERLYRVINGEGTKGEQFKWQYSKDKKSLKNNNLDVFRIGYHQLGIEDYEKGEQLVKQAKEVFKQLDNNFELKGEFDIYNKLASLKPYSEADRVECEKGFSYQNKQAGEVEDVENEEEQD